MTTALVTEWVEGTCSKCANPGQVFRVFVTHDGKAGTSAACCAGCLQSPLELALMLEETPVEGLRRPITKRRRKRVDALEKSIAKAIGGRTQPASGAMPWAKGDVRKKGEYRVEHKSTEAKTYGLSLEILKKIEGEAAYPEKPALVVDFLEKGSLRLNRRYVVIPFEDWEAVNGPGSHK